MKLYVNITGDGNVFTHNGNGVIIPQLSGQLPILHHIIDAVENSQKKTYYDKVTEVNVTALNIVTATSCLLGNLIQLKEFVKYINIVKPEPEIITN